MQFYKVTLISILNIFLLSGCITLNNDDELQQIKNLQNDLNVAHQATLKLQDNLKESQNSLLESQSKTEQLNELIYKNKQEAKAKAKKKSKLKPTKH
ncbi:hypothetical protein JI57_00415, partial [Psychromonas sp. PRT-SC03]